MQKASDIGIGKGALPAALGVQKPPVQAGTAAAGVTAEPCGAGDGTLVKVQVRRAGVMILQETYIVSRPGDLQHARTSALTVATQRRPDLPADDLLARVDPVVDAGAWPPPSPKASRPVPASAP